MHPHDGQFTRDFTYDRTVFTARIDTTTDPVIGTIHGPAGNQVATMDLTQEVQGDMRLVGVGNPETLLDALIEGWTSGQDNKPDPDDEA